MQKGLDIAMQTKHDLSTAQHSTAQHSTAQHSTAENSCNWGIVSKYRTELMGIATLFVLLHHGNAFNWPEKIHFILKLIDEVNVGVDIFLFLSGIGLYFSMRKNANILEFYGRRFSRIIPSYLMLAIPLYAILILILDSKSFFDYIMNLSSIGFWLPNLRDSTSWYVAFIIPLYILYPMLYFCFSRFYEKENLLLFVCIVIVFLLEVLLNIYCREYFAQIEIAITRLPIFIVGCYCASFVYEKAQIKLLPIKLILWVIIFLCIRIVNMIYIDNQNVLYDAIVHNSKFFLTLIIIWLVCIIFEHFGNIHKGQISNLLKFFNFFGRYSFEVYIAHTLLNNIYLHSFMYSLYPQFWVYYLVIVPVSIFIAVAVKKISASAT